MWVFSSRLLGLLKVMIGTQPRVLTPWLCLHLHTASSPAISIHMCRSSYAMETVIFTIAVSTSIQEHLRGHL